MGCPGIVHCRHCREPLDVYQPIETRFCSDECEADASLMELKMGTCETCGAESSFAHDHRPDNTGLDDGPPLRTPRKKMQPKPADETRAIRAQAWATRRQKYGQPGHR